jgi:protein O-GlcNAc transferase
MNGIDPRLAAGLEHARAGRLEEARGEVMRLLGEEPGHLGAMELMVQIEATRREFVSAAEWAGKLSERVPGDAEVVLQRGYLLMLGGREEEAVPLLERVLVMRPGNVRAVKFLLAALGTLRLPARAVGLLPMVAGGVGAADASVWGLMAEPLLMTGRADEAVEAQWKSLEANPEDVAGALALASQCNYATTLTRERIAEVHAWAGGMLARSLGWVEDGSVRAAWRGEGRLKVGLVSADLRRHSVAYFVEPVLEHLDRERFEVVVFQTVEKSDEVTARLRGHGRAWRECGAMSDGELGAAIAAEKLDVVVELSGLTHGQRLGALVGRPAGVCATWLGYPNTTGCPFVDFRVVDELTDPAGMGMERLNTERLVRMEGPFVCYRPPAGEEVPGVEERGTEGGVVFGCFGAAAKYNEGLLYAWARILAAVPGSRLVIKARGLREEAARASLRARLAVYGAKGDRVEVMGPVEETRGHLAAYGGVDIALDTYPYNGTTTTCEAMLMGVPTVTRVGDRHAARVGLSLNSAVGLADLCAGEEGSYVQVAVELARDRRRLAELRRGMRGRLLGSALGDGAGFARRFGAALEGMARAGGNGG